MYPQERRFPPNSRPPRPNVMKRSKYNSWGLPLAIGLVVALMAWVGLSALFSTDQPREGEITNTVSRPLPSSGSPQAGLDRTGIEETGLDETGSDRTSSAPAAPLVRPSLVADSPMVQAALKVSPISSRLDSGGVGQSLIKTFPPKIIAQPPAPAIPPSTLAQAKPAAKPTPPAATAAPAPQVTDPAAVSATGEELPVPGTAPATAPATASDLRFTVHLASLELKANADRALAELQAAGVPAFLTRIELDGKTYYRLMAGQFNSQTEADAYGKQLVARGLTRNMGAPVAKPLYVAPDTK